MGKALKNNRPLVICTLRYSSNLGDGVIGDCLEHLVKVVDPARDVRHLDMAGRLAFSTETQQLGYRPDVAKAVFYHCPPIFRPLLTLLAWPALFRPSIERAWEATRPEKPFDLVFGGGQMLSDLALNFPLKFAFVAQLASRQNASMAISAVGVSKRWSPIGRMLFRRALTTSGVKTYSVRDAQSRANLEAHVKALKGRVVTTVDPGVWAAEVYGIQPNPMPAADIRVGLGVSDPSELAAYSTAPETFTEGRMLAYWSEVVRRLRGLGHKAVLFTNGSEEDEAFLNRLADRLTGDGIAFDRLTRATRPRQLADHFRRFDALVSHRLHANIIAFSAGIPSVALVWDDKVRAFTALAGREVWTLNAGADATETVDLVIASARAGVDEARRRQLKAHALSDVEAMLKRLQGSAR